MDSDPDQGNTFIWFTDFLNRRKILKLFSYFFSLTFIQKQQFRFEFFCRFWLINGSGSLILTLLYCDCINYHNSPIFIASWISNQNRVLWLCAHLPAVIDLYLFNPNLIYHSSPKYFSISIYIPKKVLKSHQICNNKN